MMGRKGIRRRFSGEGDSEVLLLFLIFIVMNVLGWGLLFWTVSADSQEPSYVSGTFTDFGN